MAVFLALHCTTARPAHRGDMITALDVLDWLAADPRRNPQVLAAVLRLDLPDPLWLAEQLTDRTRAGEQIVTLAARHPGRWDGSAAQLLDDLELVGAATLLEEPEMLPEWRQVATAALTLADEHAATWPYSNGRAWRSGVQGPAVVGALREAGRAPAYAHQMFTAAQEAGIAPDTFGYGPGVTAHLLTTMAAAGITDRGTLAEFERAGLTVAQAADLAARGVTSRAVNAALADGVPRERWEALLPGMPATWFPDPAEPRARGLKQAGFGWDDLRFLVEHGWEHLRAYEVDRGLHYGSRRNTEPVTVDLALRAAAVTTLDGWKSWLDALASGKPGTTPRDASLPPLILHPGLGSSLETVRDLIAAGVRPSHLGVYRAAGCRSTQQVLQAVEQGITPRRAKKLLEHVGVRSESYRPLRIATFTALLAAHRELSEARAVSSEATGA